MAKKAIKSKKQTGVLKSVKKLDFKLLVAIAVVVALAGGSLVYKSFAVSYKRPTNVKCPATFIAIPVAKYTVTCLTTSVMSTKKVKPTYYYCGSYSRNASGVYVNCVKR